MNDSNAMNTLLKQGKINANIISFYGKGNELYLGGYNKTLHEKIFWLDTNIDKLSIKSTKVVYGDTEYIHRKVVVDLLLEYNGIQLPTDLYNEVFLETIKDYDECKDIKGIFVCNNNDLPQFALWFDEDYIVIEPNSYSEKIAQSKYRINVRKSNGNNIILGGDSLNRIYVVINNEDKKIGFINYDENKTQKKYQTGSKVLGGISLTISGLTIVFGITYYFLSKRKIINF